jgi:hypothetical protein
MAMNSYFASLWYCQPGGKPLPPANVPYYTTNSRRAQIFGPPAAPPASPKVLPGRQPRQLDPQALMVKRNLGVLGALVVSFLPEEAKFSSKMASTPLDKNQSMC